MEKKIEALVVLNGIEWKNNVRADGPLPYPQVKIKFGGSHVRDCRIVINY